MALKLNKTIERPIRVKHKIVSADGKCRGYRTEVVGLEAVQVELTIDTDKLFDKTKTSIGNSIYEGKDTATLGYGAVVAKVIKRRRL